MSEVKFTPGPWMAASAPSSVVGWPVVAQTGRAIASVAYLGIEPNKDRPERKAFNVESMANAHLIAAAPELYEALINARERLEYELGEGPIKDLLAEIDAALAKAEGR